MERDDDERYFLKGAKWAARKLNEKPLESSIFKLNPMGRRIEAVVERELKKQC